ncbi:asparagine synthase (glutamine-hydrolyzing) [Actinoplanes sp. NPDC048988]|uniref:asparagine synthase (glutamine-hydrolyzing) n=1 Tax=Actinoplanes sp. NPDC048988 TaxID=3363901 RepID=UPI0037109812
MCGLVGWVDFGEDLFRHGRVVAAMTATMSNRGPDDEGTWLGRHAALGHRRLAIVDPGGGAQPMVAHRSGEGKPVVLAYSGEIYNHEELRAELRGRGHVFRTRSDTEVVLRAYLQWGGECADRLNGIFAFAVWDGDREEMVLIRDRLGVKPLYYHAYDDGMLFASEPKGILANPRFRARTREDMLPVLFNSRLAMPDETPLIGLHQVHPGQVLRFDRSGVHKHQYWELVSHEHPDDEATTVKTVRELLEDVVSRQLVADVPIGTLLSGGLDSSVITALAARLRRQSDQGDVRAFAVDFTGAEDDFRSTPLRPERDTPYARLAARHLSVPYTEVVLDPASFPGVHEQTLLARDLPALGQFDQSLYQFFGAVREQSTAVLSGEAADEIFGGYPWFMRPETVSADTFPWLGNAPRLTDCLNDGVRRRIRPEDAERDRYRTMLARVPRLAGETGLRARMREVLFLSMQGPLTYLLDRKDRMSMAVGLEVRVPFCDHRLVEYLWNVPWDMKVSDGREKTLLRAAAGDLLPAQTLERRKSGYPATFAPAYAAAVNDQLTALLDDPAAPLRDLLDADRVRALAGRGGRTLTFASAEHLLTPLLEVNAWMTRYNVELVG